MFVYKQKNIVYTIYVSLVHDKKKHFILNRITLNSSIRFPRQLLIPFYTDCNHHNIYMFYTNLPYIIQIKNKFNFNGNHAATSNATILCTCAHFIWKAFTRHYPETFVPVRKYDKYCKIRRKTKWFVNEIQIKSQKIISIIEFILWFCVSY